MAWTYKAAPFLEYPQYCRFGGGRWLLATGVEVFTTADFETYSIPFSAAFTSVVDAVFAGGCWHLVVAEGYPKVYTYYRSTDGALGEAWALRAGDLYVGAQHGAGLASMDVLPSGRLVGATPGGVLVTSDVNGDSWTVRHTVTGGVSSGGYGQHVRLFDSCLLFWGSTPIVCVSTDAGATWVESTASTFGGYVSAVGLGSAVILSTDSAQEVVSADAGASWATVSSSAYLQRFARSGTRVVRVQYGPFGVAYSDDLSGWEAITGDLSYSATVAAGGGLVVALDDAGVYVQSLGGAAPAIPPISLPLELVIGRVGPPISVPLELDLVDAELTEGLDGAAGWAAAPEGKWCVGVMLGNLAISDRIHGPVKIQIADSAARTAEFAFLPASALMPMGFIGQRVEIHFAQAGGAADQPLFCGVVDVPSIDLETGVVSCVCTDQSQEIWANASREQIDALVGGRWHVAVSGEPEDNFQYLEERIQSVGGGWALDVQQQPRVVPWGGPARVLTVRSADVVDGRVDVDLPSRGELRTRIKCRFQYRFQMLRYRGISCEYGQPLSFFLPWYSSTSGLTLKESTRWLVAPLVEGATSSLPGWSLAAPAELEHPAPGSYVVTRPFLNPVLPYSELMTGAVYIIPEAVAPELVMGFSASYSARWQQSITEDYTITLVNNALEQQLVTPISEEFGASFEAEFDAPAWGSDPQAKPLVGGVGVGDAQLPWQPAGFDQASCDEAIRTLLDRAWVRLWASSRSGRVRFDLPARPDLWLDTRIHVEHERIRAAGKIVELTHVLDMQSGSAITSVTLAVGMPGNTPASHPQWDIPPVPADPYTPPAAAFECAIGTYVGGTEEAPPFDDASMVGFSTNIEGPFPDSEVYPHQLRIKAPDLAPEDRDPREAVVETTLNVTVPTDFLEIL